MIFEKTSAQLQCLSFKEGKTVRYCQREKRYTSIDCNVQMLKDLINSHAAKIKGTQIFQDAFFSKTIFLAGMTKDKAMS